MTKEELLILIEQLTEPQVEYIYNLIKALFCQGTN